MLLMSGGPSAGGSAGSATAVLGDSRVSMTRSTASSPTSAAPATSQGVRSRGSALSGEPTEWPQREQKRAMGDKGGPHAGHGAPARGAPQAEQNFPPPSTPQEGQGVVAVLVMVTKLADSGELVAGQLIHDPAAADGGPEHHQPRVTRHHLTHPGGPGTEGMSAQARQGRLGQ